MSLSDTPKPDGGPEFSWRDAYLRQRRTSRVFAGVAVLLGVALVASLATLFLRPFSASTTAEPQVSATGSASPATGGADRREARRSVAERFFTDAGALDNEQVERAKEQFQARPAAGDRLRTRIGEAAQAGQITQAQADQLLKALGLR